MNFHFAHNCLYVFDLQRSLDFYKNALGLEPVRQMHPSDQNVTLVFLSDGSSDHELELAYRSDRKTPYDPGDSHFHTAFTTKDMTAARARHTAMGCIIRDPETEPVYFIADPDGYEIEISPAEEHS